jgi:hypothetical protein
MQTVLKYDISGGYTSLNLSTDFKVLKLAEQRGRTMVWIQQSSAGQPAKMSVRFSYVATAENFDARRTQYIDTIIDVNDEVWHHYFAIL